MSGAYAEKEFRVGSVIIGHFHGDKRGLIHRYLLHRSFLKIDLMI